MQTGNDSLYQRQIPFHENHFNHSTLSSYPLQQSPWSSSTPASFYSSQQSQPFPPLYTVPAQSDPLTSLGTSPILPGQLPILRSSGAKSRSHRKSNRYMLVCTRITSSSSCTAGCNITSPNPPKNNTSNSTITNVLSKNLVIPEGSSFRNTANSSSNTKEPSAISAPSSKRQVSVHPSAQTPPAGPFPLPASQSVAITLSTGSPEGSFPSPATGVPATLITPTPATTKNFTVAKIARALLEGAVDLGVGI
jgi:hypothetical protein